MEKLKNLKELIELKSIQEEGNKKLHELQNEIEREIQLHSIEQPKGIFIKEFGTGSEAFAKEFGFFTNEERETMQELQSIQFAIALSLRKEGHFKFLAEPLAIFRANHYSFSIGIEHGISDKKINEDFFSISDLRMGNIILFEKEKHFLSIKKQIEEMLPSIHEIFAVVNNNYYS